MQLKNIWTIEEIRVIINTMMGFAPYESLEIQRCRNMEIRRANYKDVEKLNDLLLQVCEVHHKGRSDLFKKGAKKYTDEELISIIHNSETPILVAVNNDDKVLGYVFCIFKQYTDNNILNDVKTLYIDDLCVDENHRGKHIGSMLYDAALELAKENGCYNVTLNVWELNDDAKRFYNSKGMNVLKTEMEQIL